MEEVEYMHEPIRRGTPQRRLQATPWATSYESDALDVNNGVFTEADLELLAHVNCSHLSSGTAPTLLSLKQHARSLAILIQKISAETRQVLINGNDEVSNDENINTGTLENEAFDWLADLTKPYDNTDAYHSVPLWRLQNTIASENEVKGPVHHCPVAVRRNLGSQAMHQLFSPPPFSSAHGLLMHANECLELLDHDYGATGGLLSILPTDGEHDSEQMASARHTLIGQWLVQHQHLVSRAHELELDLANMADVVAHRTEVPRQLADNDIRTVPRLTRPQGRYVLANVGDDMTHHLHGLLDRREDEVRQREELWRAHGVSGTRLLNKGLVQVDVVSRITRVKADGRNGPLYVLPCSEDFPGVQASRSLERRAPEIHLVARQPGEGAVRRREWEEQRAAECAREVDLLRERCRKLQRDYEQEVNAKLFPTGRREIDGKSWLPWDL